MTRPPSDDLSQLVEFARAGDGVAVGRLLELYRAHLRALARHRLGRDLSRRLDASDLVQQTFLDAHQNFANFAGSGGEQVLAWLRRILNCNVSNAIRDNFLAQKRAAGAERSLDDSSGGGTVADRAPAGSSSPSRQLIRVEETLRFLQVLEELPPDQADAVRLRYLEGLSIGDVAAVLHRSRVAAAGLVKRGMQGLRRLMDTKEA